MKKICLFICIIITISCSTDPENKCMYKNVKLDTTNKTLNKTEIIATWSLQSFVNLSDCSIKNEPENFSTPLVVINFQDSAELKGHTANEFIGNYTISSNKIQLTINSLTEINEPEWALKFLEAAEMTDYAFIENSRLFVFFDQFLKVMIFHKN